MIQGKRTEKRGKGKGRIAAVLAAVLLVTSVTAVTGLAAEANTLAYLDDGKTVQGGTVTVTIPKDKAFDQLRDLNENGKVAVDLYEVASAKQLVADGVAYDAYVFDWDGFGFTGDSKTMYDKIQKNTEEGGTVTASDVNGFTQALAQVIQGGSVKAKHTGTLEEPVTVSEGGLYLVLVHSGGDKKAYMQKGEGDTPLVTVADAGGRQYQFAPMLLSIPTRGSAQLSGDLFVNGRQEWGFAAFAGNTANTDTGWNYQLSMEVKAAVGDATGRLLITKNLQNYETMENRIDKVTFVYRITARMNGQEVFSDVASIELDGPDTGTTYVYGIPVGAEITVEEIYQGGDYAQTAVVPSSTPLVVVPYDPESKTDEGTVASITFTNTHNGGYKGGGSVKNTYGTAADEKGTSWSWSSTPQQTIADDASIR